MTSTSLVVSLIALLSLMVGCAAQSAGGDSPARDLPSVSLAPEPTGPLAGLAFMAGSWSMQSGDNVTEEHWMNPRGTIMVGMARTSKGDKSAFFEYLRIQSRADGVFYIASPAGRAPTEFKLVIGGQPGDTEAVFENLAHDFPQRITYRRLSANALQARIEGDQGGKPASEEFAFERAGAGVRLP